jgi:hypothetical protein
MAQTLGAYTASITWTNLVAQAGFTGGNAARVILEGQSAYPTRVCFGGASAPASADYGSVLGMGDVIDGTAATVWVRADSPMARILVTLGD